MVALKEARVRASLQIEPDSREEAEHPTPIGELEEISLAQTRQIKIWAAMSPTRKESLVALLREFFDLFAWTLIDMPGINPTVISHRLTINSCARPIIHKQRPMGAERHKAVWEEVAWLLDAGFIEEVRFQTSVANIVLVRKPNGKWSMCV